MKSKFQPVIFVRLEEDDNQLLYRACRTMFEASEEDGEETDIATYRLERIVKAKRVVQIKP